MRTEIVVLILFLFLFTLLVFFYILRAFYRFYKERERLKHRDISQVGFVVDTFHELVSKLKEKERELEVLRQKAEDRALAIEGYNENILQSVPSGVISFDEELKITKMNLSAKRMLDIKEEMVVGKHYTEILNKPVTDLLYDRKIVDRGEISYITATGRRIWLGLNLHPLKDREGRTIGQILIFTDLSELKAFQSQMTLRERLTSLGEMSAGIAHELRNPMGVIAGYTKLLSKKVDDPLKPSVEAIIKEVETMDRIIADFLSFAKLTELNIIEINLKKIIEDCAFNIIGERTDIKANILFDVIPKIKGDEVLLRQAFTNLIQNAVEAMPKGGEIVIFASAGDYLEVSITDTGHGIPEGIEDKIFLPFYTTKEKGTGLGLAIVHKIVVSHGGDIFVESSGGKTTFRIRFPRSLISPSHSQES
ncbi:MAG: PAS domain-containing protein [Nitrospirae bacterium]|nr:PAS domain-containing protein [Nitrospirota bacterium]